jgi:CheY-like chemotaxis protein
MPEPKSRSLVLLVDNDITSRRETRHLLEGRGLDVVQASNGIAALELVQRLPDSFRLVLADSQLPGISGRVVVDTLRLFRPDLPSYCLAVMVMAGGRPPCLAKPLRDADLNAVLKEIAVGWAPQEGPELRAEVVSRARQRFNVTSDLVEAAYELSG